MNQKRRTQIVKLLEEQQALTNQELMERFDISIETVRRDLAYLESIGALTRVYGGAVKKDVVKTEPLYSSREQENNREKLLIAKEAQRFISPDDAVFFDLGTTVENVAKRLDKAKNIHAFTNSVRAAVTLCDKCADVILTGGRIRQGELSLSGTLSLDNVSKFNITTAIIGAGGITEQGVSDFIVDEAGLRSRVIENAEKVIVLADYKKFGVRAVCKVCEFSDVDVLITDDKAPKNVLKKIRNAGVQVVVVK